MKLYETTIKLKIRNIERTKRLFDQFKIPDKINNVKNEIENEI